MAEIRSIVGYVLTKCMKAYDPDREGKFNTYYYAAIKNAVNDFKRANHKRYSLLISIDDVPEYISLSYEMDYLSLLSEAEEKRAKNLSDNSNGFDLKLGVKPSNFIDYVVEKYQMSKSGVVRGILNFWLLKVYFGKSIIDIQNTYYENIHENFMMHMVSSIAGEFDVPEFKVRECAGEEPFEKVEFDSDLTVQNHLDKIIREGRSYNNEPSRRYKIYASSGLKTYIKQFCRENDTSPSVFYAGIIKDFAEILLAIRDEHGLAVADAYIKRLGEFQDVADKVMSGTLP